MKKRVVTTVRKTGPVEKIHGVVVRILSRIEKVLSLNCGSGTKYSDIHFLRFSSVLPGNVRISL